MNDIDREALEVARLALEDALIDLRDSRISVLSCGNGFVVREADGTESSAIRLATRDGLRIGIKAYLAAAAVPEPAAERSRDVEASLDEKVVPGPQARSDSEVGLVTVPEPAEKGEA